MSDIKLTYFPAKGRAEISRLILSYSGVKFTDERLSPEQFGAIKSSLPWGQIPVMNYKGQLMCQSLSIARWVHGCCYGLWISFVWSRFLAAEFGLAGKNNLESAQANEIVDAVSDLQNAMVKVVFGKDEKGVQNVLDNVYPAGLVRRLFCMCIFSN